MSRPLARSLQSRFARRPRRALSGLAFSACAALAAALLGSVTTPLVSAAAQPPPPSSLNATPQPIDLRARAAALRTIERAVSSAPVVAGDRPGTPIRSVSSGAATFTVNSTADDTDGSCDVIATGDCTLREAIIAANASPSTDNIEFDIAGTGPHVIGILSDLPDINEAVILDGTTEPDFVSTPVVVLDGSASTGPSGFGLSIPSSGSTIRGLCIHSFDTHSAILVWNGATGTVIQGNFIGTDPTGTTSIGTGSGIDLVNADDNTIGGTTAAARNIIAGATLPAIVLRQGSDSNDVFGNYMGLDISGTVHLPNVGNDLSIYDSANNTVGGATAGQRNVMAGNTDAALPSVGLASELDGDPNTNSENNVVAGNYIGTDVTGNVPFGSASVAVYLQDAGDNTIGGAGAAGNVIGASGLEAVRILAFALGPSVAGSDVIGNLIGVGANGTTPLPIALNAVRFSHATSGNMLQDNVIANAALNGVLVRGDAGTGNRITENSIRSNGSLGIDLSANLLGTDGVTDNDAGDADTGPNDFQNFPAITDVNGLGQVVGTLSSTSSSSFTIEVYLSTSCDPSGFGEAETFVGSATAVMTNGSGQATFTVTPSSAIPLESYLTATATNAAGSTSELSACFLFTDLLFTDGFETGDTSRWSETEEGSP